VYGQEDRWVALARSIITELESSTSHLVDELLAGRASAYLMIEGRPRRSDQRCVTGAPATPWRPRHVNRAITMMEADPAAICSLADLAHATKVSVRTLQVGFRQHTGTSPMGYLRQLRLMRVHEDLLAADQRHHTVARIAHRHGFSHLGRFAAAYRAAYGCNPSATQRLSGAVQQPAAAHGRPTADADAARLVIAVRCAQRAHRS
jgi:transcriptional regulator GlxA family with amidase domain